VALCKFLFSYFPTMAVPDGTACYICLDERAEKKKGMPLMQDCSCRGSAGYAHLTCIAEAVKHKCRLATAEEITAFVEPWENCPGCKQGYMNQLSVNLSDAFIAFVETSYWHPGNGMWDKIKVMAAI
jgi:hypothetical protein